MTKQAELQILDSANKAAEAKNKQADNLLHNAGSALRNAIRELERL